MRVFLSHAYQDRQAAEVLIARLARAHVEVWDPNRDLEPGENRALKIGEALEKADTMIVLLSPDAARSPWVQGEIEYALTSPKFEGRLIVVELKPTKQVPWILKKMRPIRCSDITQAGRLVLLRVRHLAKAAAHAT